MTTLEPNEVLTFLHGSQLLTVSQLEVLERERYTTESSEQLVEGLVQRGWLTTFQKKQVLAGQGDKLVVGPFRLLQPLGEGGMGVVYLAWQPKLDRNVALKVIRPQILAVRPEVVLRFHREARAIAKLMHPNIVILYDADEASGMHFIAMEYVDGMSLEKMVRLNGPLMIRQACDYIRQCGLGLQHAHEMGMVHRDIKPSNLLVARKQVAARTSDTGMKRPALVTQRDREMSIDARETNKPGSWGSIKILDMGLARLADSLDEEGHGETPLTRAGVLLGTPDFIAPEQARDARQADGRADIYSLGCTFYYLLTGRPPFPGGTDVQKLLRHQSDRPTPVDELRPHIPTAVVTILHKMMEKKLENRYQNGQELANALEDYLKSTLIPSGPGDGSPSPFPAAITLPTPHGVSDTRQDLPPIPSSEPVATAMVTVYSAGHEIGTTGYIQAHKSVVSGVAFSRDGSRVASVGIDGRIRVWDFSVSPVAEVAGLPRPGTELNCVCFAPHDDFLVVGGTQKKDCRVWRWDWKESRVFDWGNFTDQRCGIGAMAFSTDGRQFAAGIGNQIAVWKLSGRDSKSRSLFKGHESAVRALSFSPDGKMIASGAEDKLLKLWTFGWRGPREKASCEGHTDTVTSLMFNPADSRIISGSQDQSVVIWESTDPSFDSAVSMGENKGTIRLARLLPDGRHLLSVADSGLVTLWDVVTCTRLSDCQLDISMVSCLALDHDGTRIVIGTSDGRMRMFSLQAILPKR